MSFAQILPLAFVMIAGPQIVSSFFFATSERWAANSIAYVAGAAISVTAVVTIAYFAARGVKTAAGHKSGNVTIEWVVLVLLVYLIVRVYLTRGKAEPPKWMSRLQTAEPKFALGLGGRAAGRLPDRYPHLDHGRSPRRPHEWLLVGVPSLCGADHAVPGRAGALRRLSRKRGEGRPAEDPRLDELACLGDQRDRPGVLRRACDQQHRQGLASIFRDLDCLG